VVVRKGRGGNKSEQKEEKRKAAARKRTMKLSGVKWQVRKPRPKSMATDWNFLREQPKIEGKKEG